ncbi:MAG: DUF481 domain-containing protein [Pseudomonadales bacterium]|nr:DUF481 domain-containing protein [Pseudomonadales bacterium]
MKVFATVFILLMLSPAAFSQWDPEPPVPDKWDWLQLKSGEWLKGELVALYADELEFESDELDTLFFDIDDIKRIRSGKTLNVMLINHQTVSGLLILDGHQFSMRGSEQFYLSQDILTVIPDSETEASLWAIKFSLGVNLRSGNAQQVDVNSSLKARRRTIANRFVFDYMANYSETENTVTDKNHRISSALDVFLTDALFIRPIFAEYLKDPFQNIADKFTVGSGLGYQVIDTNRVEWSMVTGPAYLTTQFIEVEEGASDKEDSGAFVTSTNLEVELSSDIDFFYDYRFTLVSEAVGLYTHHMVTGLEIELGQYLDLDLSMVWDRTQKPKKDALGDEPEKDDYRVIIGIGFDY